MRANKSSRQFECLNQPHLAWNPHYRLFNQIDVFHLYFISVLFIQLKWSWWKLLHYNNKWVSSSNYQLQLKGRKTCTCALCLVSIVCTELKGMNGLIIMVILHLCSHHTAAGVPVPLLACQDTSHMMLIQRKRGDVKHPPQTSIIIYIYFSNGQIHENRIFDEETKAMHHFIYSIKAHLEHVSLDGLL